MCLARARRASSAAILALLVGCDDTPTQVDEPLDEFLPPLQMVSIEIGTSYSCGIAIDGNTYCWGNNLNDWMLGTSSPDLCSGFGGEIIQCSMRPALRVGSQAFEQLSVGNGMACALEGGEGVCWGTNRWSRLGNGSSLDTSVPTTIGGGLALVEIRTYARAVCGLVANGEAYCWGDNTYGQLGVPPGTALDPLPDACSDGSGPATPCAKVPVAVSGGLSFVALSKGDSGAHACAITASGVAYCWGANNAGQLGDGTTTEDPVSVPAEVIGDFDFTAIAVGNNHTCALDAGGSIYCWGFGGDGELGDGMFESSPVPVPVAGGHTFTDVAAGDHYSCGIATSGDAYCWGNAFDGKVGTGSVPTFSSDRSDLFIGEPSLVVGEHAFTSIDASFFHTCALTVEGAAYCWGFNLFGQIGDGTRVSRGTPTAVLGPASSG